MSRLNIINTKHLTNIHLVAEYKEITQFLHLIKRRIDRGIPFNDLPPSYTLNGGHCLFFYNKGGYILRRFEELRNEMLERGMKVCPQKYTNRREKILLSFSGREDLLLDYQPNRADYSIAIERIALRINQKLAIYPDKSRFFENLSLYL